MVKRRTINIAKKVIGKFPIIGKPFRKIDLPKGADLTDVFKGKNIKNPKTFLKKRKEVVGKMTKKKGVMKIGIKKAAKPDKTLVKAREETLRKSPKGSTLRKITKQFEEEMKARQELKKLGRGFRKGGTVRRKPNKDRYETGGAVKKRVGIDFDQVVQKVKRVAGHLKKVMEKPKKVKYKKMQEGGKVRAGAKGTQSGEAGRMSTARMKAKNRRDKIKEILKGEVPLHHMRKQIKDIKYGRKFQEGGQAKVEDPRFTPQAQTFEEADAILDLARKRKPSGVIGQDDINAAREEYNRRKELRRMRQADTAPIPMPKTSKRTLVKPMDPNRRADSSSRYTPGPGYFADDPSRGLPEAGPARRPEQDRYTIDEGMVIKPTDDYVRRRLGMKEGGSVSNKPKQRGWGKAIKGTKFKGTF